MNENEITEEQKKKVLALIGELMTLSSEERDYFDFKVLDMFVGQGKGEQYTEAKKIIEA